MKAHDQATVVAFQRALRAIRGIKRKAQLEAVTGRLGLCECCVCGKLKGYAMLSDFGAAEAPVSHGYCNECAVEQYKAIEATPNL